MKPQQPGYFSRCYRGLEAPPARPANTAPTDCQHVCAEAEAVGPAEPAVGILDRQESPRGHQPCHHHQQQQPDTPDDTDQPALKAVRDIPGAASHSQAGKAHNERPGT
eukprot:scaffold462353_cov23-Prasinocladus_malaysianus.AAC.1